MKSIFDTNLSCYGETIDNSDEFVKKTASVIREVEEILKNPKVEIEDVYTVAKQISHKNPLDAGMKFVCSKLKDLFEDFGSSPLPLYRFASIKDSCEKLFPDSYGSRFFEKDAVYLAFSPSYNFKPLEKVAKSIHTQTEYNIMIRKLGYVANSPKDVVARYFMKDLINKRLGEEIVTDDSFDENAPKVERDAMFYLNESVSKYADDLDVDYEGSKEDFSDIDFRESIETFREKPLHFGKFSDEYKSLSALDEDAWDLYQDDMQNADIDVSYDYIKDEYVVKLIDAQIESQINVEAAEDAPDITEIKEIYDISPGEPKKPSKVKKKLKTETISLLSGQAKEAMTKLHNRTANLREIKERQLLASAELTDAKNKLIEEKSEMAVELEGYLKMADASFNKMGLVLDASYALETQEGVIMTAITQEFVDFPLEGREVVSKDAATILELLKKAGNITEEMIHEAEKRVDDMNKGIKFLRQITKTVRTWPLSQEDVEKVRPANKKKALFGLGEEGFWNWMKESLVGIKKFFGFSDRTSDKFLEIYGDLQEILIKY